MHFTSNARQVLIYVQYLNNYCDNPKAPSEERNYLNSLPTGKGFMAEETHTLEFLGAVKEWNDKKKMKALFCALPIKREINESSFDSKIHFWSNFIINFQKFKKQPKFTLHELKTKITLNGVPPLCLEGVVNNMIKKSSLVEINSIKKLLEKRKQSWISWVIKTPTDYFYSRQLEENEPLIISENLFEQCDLLWKTIDKKVIYPSDRLLLLEEFENVLEKLKKKTDFELIDKEFFLIYLEYSNILIPFYTKEKILFGIKVIPYRPSFNWHQNHQKLILKNLSTMDLSCDYHILQVRKTIFNSEKYLEQIQAKVEKSKNKAKQFLVQKEKKLALLHLKHKNYFEKKYMDQLSTLHNLEKLYDAIKNAESDQVIISALSAGSASLKILNKDINIDELDSVLVDLQEASELQNQFADSLQSDDPFDEDELEKELENLINESKPEPLESKHVQSIPSKQPFLQQNAPARANNQPPAHPIDFLSTQTLEELLDALPPTPAEFFEENKPQTHPS